MRSLAPLALGLALTASSALADIRDQTLVGHFENVVCAGSCPGLAFDTVQGSQIWLDAASVAATGVTTAPALEYLLKGHYEDRRVFDERQGYILEELFVVTTAERVYTAP